ncbi:hypothetical protein Bbelb_042650 [Branchiostoma belcheri]|nr:hypothetical protein Bbelb_042650 [Branchiostoma belcheri]
MHPAQDRQDRAHAMPSPSGPSSLCHVAASRPLTARGIQPADSRQPSCVTVRKSPYCPTLGSTRGNANFAAVQVQSMVSRTTPFVKGGQCRGQQPRLSSTRPPPSLPCCQPATRLLPGHTDSTPDSQPPCRPTHQTAAPCPATRCRFVPQPPSYPALILHAVLPQIVLPPRRCLPAEADHATSPRPDRPRNPARRLQAALVSQTTDPIMTSGRISWRNSRGYQTSGNRLNDAGTGEPQLYMTHRGRPKELSVFTEVVRGRVELWKGHAQTPE